VEDLFSGEHGESSRQFSIEEASRHNDILTIFRKSMAAHSLYKKDRDYVEKDGQIIIVDEFTGRLMVRSPLFGRAAPGN